MKTIIPFNRRSPFALSTTGFNDFYNVIDDFFSGSSPSRCLSRDTFKIDVQETEKEFFIEAELPGVKKEEIDLDLEDGKLTISINKSEGVDENQGHYIHRERRYTSMNRSIYLADAKSEDIKAKLEHGILFITVQKQEKQKNSYKINID